MKWFGLIFCLFSVLWKPDMASEHALYLSSIQLKHALQDTSAILHIKVFTDDLQNAIRNYSKQDYIPSQTENFIEKNIEKLEAYFQKHLICRVNQQPSPPRITKHRLENEVYVISFKLHCPSNWQTLSVKADYFMELFPSQTNVIQLDNGPEKTIRKIQQKQSLSKLDFLIHSHPSISKASHTHTHTQLVIRIRNS